MWRRLFNIVTVASLLLGIVSGALWARTSGHFEKLSFHYHRWPAKKEVHSYHLGFVWYYGGRLRIRGSYRTLTTAYFDGHPSEVLKRAHAEYIPGLKCAFFDQSNAFISPEFPFREIIHWRSSPMKHGHYWHLAVRLWLPTLLSGVLPTIWICRWQGSKDHPWQFSTRELFLVFTFLAIVLGLVTWLAN